MARSVTFALFRELNMMRTSVSRHARARMQQRGIAASAIDCLLDFGRERHDHHGAVVVVLDRAALRRIARSGAARGPALDELRGLYAVVAPDGRGCTVGHRTRRLWTH